VQLEKFLVSLHHKLLKFRRERFLLMLDKWLSLSINLLALIVDDAKETQNVNYV